MDKGGETMFGQHYGKHLIVLEHGQERILLRGTFGNKFGYV